MNEMERPKVEGDLPQGFLASDVREIPGPEGHRPEDVVLLQEGEPISPGTLVALMQGREKVLNEHAKPVLHLAGAAGETWQDQLDELRASGLAALILVSSADQSLWLNGTKSLPTTLPL